MPRYINFTTSSKNPHVRNTFGSAVHDEKIPAARHSILGVQVDKHTIDFADSSIPDKLHRALLEGGSVIRKKAVFDCIVFAALMQCVDIGEPDEEGLFAVSRESIEQEIDPESLAVTTALNLGMRSRRSAGIEYRHTVTPAHTTTEAMYLHKLGDSGPVCFSDLAVAFKVFGCNIAHPALLDPQAAV